MRTMLLGAAFGALLACGPTPQPEQTARTDAPGPALPGTPTELPTIPTDAAAGPSGTDNMTWTYSNGGRTETGAARPRLTYHTGGSEGLAINIQCDPGTNVAHAYLWRGQQRPTWPFSLVSGSARADLQGQTSGESEVTVHGALPLDAPALLAFRNTGALTLIDGDMTLPMSAINDQERRAIGDFFAACA
jgi:hypothetical protein